MAGTEIGLRVKRLRADVALTQGQLATFAEVDRSWVSLLERGGIDSPAGDKLSRVARVLGVDVEYLLNGRLAEGEDPRLNAQLDQFKSLPAEVRDFLLQVARGLRDLPMRALYEQPPPHQLDQQREQEQDGQDHPGAQPGGG